MENTESLTVISAWKIFTMLDCVKHIALSYTAIKQTTFNSCWKKLWPNVVKNEHSISTLNEYSQIVQMAHSLSGEGFDDFTDGDIAELMADKELSEDDLVNLVCESESDKSDEEELVPVTFTAKVIREGLALGRKLGNHFMQNDTNVERASRFKRDINRCLAQYEEVYKDLTKNSKQLLITDFITISLTIHEYDMNKNMDIFSNLIIIFDMPRKRSAIGVRTPAARRMAARAARGQSSRTLENPQQSQARLQSDRLRHRVQRASETPQQSQTRQEADRLRHFRQRASTWADMLNAAFHYNPALNYEQFTFLQIGHMDKQCLHCTAFKYNGERPGMCCSAGKVRIPDLPEPPEALRTLLDGSFPHSAEFMQRVRHNNNAGGLYFLDAPGGTGKTFLINLLLTKVRSTGDIALSTASTGIAATLLHGGRTAHSTFKLPLDLTRDEVPVCNLNADSAMVEVLRQCKFIVWDECTMAYRHALEAVDITLKDCRQDQRPMGGVVLLLAGDFRQILPIIPRGTIADELHACLKASPLWSFVERLTLLTNMRAVNSGDPNSLLFSQFLLQLGSGQLNDTDGNVNFSNELVNTVVTPSLA
ncbi:hypothetical protein LAZ67_8002211 [Cordylochernes scorpioides]|uniref:ATP-dependent DNA helicase n=1 Tax=Cordylochernes scorpioides TaxID=51811 RepID=A0ABY6KRH8_9ARAC|nr:hypothetical protein LAZ67_8002211 [Cordylochernes scorpioides]